MVLEHWLVFTMIKSRKNILRETAAITTSTTFNFAVAVDSPDSSLAVNAGNQVAIGSKVHRIFVELWVYGTLGSGVNNPYDWYIIKNNGGNITQVAPQNMATSNDDKKFVIQQGKGLLGRLQEGSPPYVIKGWIKIPKPYQRMGKNDTISLQMNSAGANFCIFIVYKYFE